MKTTKRNTGRFLWLGVILILPVAYLYQLFPHVHDLHDAHSRSSAHESSAALGHHAHSPGHDHSHSSADTHGHSRSETDPSGNSGHHHSLTNHLDSHSMQLSGQESDAGRMLVGEIHRIDRNVAVGIVRYLIPDSDRSPPHLLLRPSSGPRSPPVLG
jgi:hypothetical protein